jgi:hypothetical protein
MARLCITGTNRTHLVLLGMQNRTFGPCLAAIDRHPHFACGGAFGSCPGPAANYATWESLVLGVANARSLRALRRQAAAAAGSPPPPRVGPRLRVARGATFDERLGRYVLPFPGGEGHKREE